MAFVLKVAEWLAASGPLPGENRFRTELSGIAADGVARLTRRNAFLLLASPIRIVFDAYVFAFARLNFWTVTFDLLKSGVQGTLKLLDIVRRRELRIQRLLILGADLVLNVSTAELLFAPHAARSTGATRRGLPWSLERNSDPPGKQVLRVVRLEIR